MRHTFIDVRHEYDLEVLVKYVFEHEYNDLAKLRFFE
jgi:hypothetical protein